MLLDSQEIKKIGGSHHDSQSRLSYKSSKPFEFLSLNHNYKFFSNNLDLKLTFFSLNCQKAKKIRTLMLPKTPSKGEDKFRNHPSTSNDETKAF